MAEKRATNIESTPNTLASNSLMPATNMWWPQVPNPPNAIPSEDIAMAGEDAGRREEGGEQKRRRGRGADGVGGQDEVDRGQERRHAEDKNAGHHRNHRRLRAGAVRHVERPAGVRAAPHHGSQGDDAANDVRV